MQVPCIREASKACSNCCLNPFLGQPESRNHPTISTRYPNNPQQEFVAAISSSIQPNSQFTNPESLPPLAESLSCLNKACPQHLKTSLADQIRSQEYYHLSLSNRVCLDYIGNGLFSYSQQESHHSRASIASTSLSPPIQVYSTDSDVPFFDISYRSVNLDSQLLYGGQESEFESSMRRRVMRYMNLSEDDYSMVFTANQASAFKLLADSYPFESNQNLLTVYDHNSEAMEAMIESSTKKGAQTLSAEFSWPSLRINSRKLRKIVLHKGNKKKRGLFVFPLQSRITGARYSYLWMNMAQENGWHILLDADALGAKPMDTMGLSLFNPDFLICSFFKVFGENPSGFSCLFVKKSSISVLSKSSTSIGIVSLVPTLSMSRQSTFAEIEIEDENSTMPLKKDKATVPTTSSRLRSLGEMMREESFEIQEAKHFGKMRKELSFSELANLDRTVESDQPGSNEGSSNQSSEIECRGLDHADTIGLILISTRAKYQVNWLINALVCLRHPHSENGLPLIRIYGPKIRFNRGSAVAFNVFDWKGEKIDPTLVQKLADRNNISLTCGFLRHLWFSDTYNEVKDKILETDTETAKRTKEEHKKKGKYDAGISVVTASIGFLTNFEDLYRLWSFISRFLDADFVEKERWRYTALNQTTVEV